MNHRLLILPIAILLSACNTPTKILQQNLEKISNNFPGEVGIALIAREDTVCIHGDKHFPMFSVVKFHQALAVNDKLRNGQVPVLDKSGSYDIKVTVADLKPDTWSPLRDKFPKGGNFSIQQLLEYTLVESDNNACDILFARTAHPAEVEAYIHGLDIQDCGIAWTEDEQHEDMNRCYDNWTTPLAAAQLLGKFYEMRDSDDYSRFVWKTMANCQTGANRIPKYIADKTQLIVHKTGTGGPAPDGKVMGINDIACIILPDGRHFELAVFIKDADCTPEKCEEVIARIANLSLAYVESGKTLNSKRRSQFQHRPARNGEPTDSHIYQ